MANAGWYNDEIDPTLARWFDGAGWTEHTLVKAEWEGAGQAPPAPEEPDDLAPNRPGGPRQLRLAVAGAVALAVLVVGGVALAGRDDGGGDPPKPTTSNDQKDTTADRVDDDTTITGFEVTGDGTGVDDGSATPGSDDATAVGGTGSTKAGTSGGKTTPTTAKSTVQRSSTLTESHTNNNPVGGEVTKGDQESIGSKSDKSIKDTFVPPPTTEAPTTTIAPPDSIDPGPIDQPTGTDS